MKRPEFRLLQTTAVRLALKSVAVYGLLVLLALGSLYWYASSAIDQTSRSSLQKERQRLQQVYAKSGLAAVVDEIGGLQGVDNRIYYLAAPSGEKLAGNLFAWPEDLELDATAPVQGAWINDEVIPPDIYQDDAYWPVAMLAFDDGSRLLLAHKVEQAEVLLELSEYLLDAMLIALAFALFIAISLGRQILGRVDIISDTASHIMAGDLSQRIPLSDRNDEFDRLAGNLNAMLDRNQQLIKGMREVTDNVAHDLRSPLTRLRNQMEITLLEPRSEDEYRKVLSQSIKDVEYLIKTFNALLSIAQAEAGNHRTLWGEVDLKQLAMDLADLYTPLADEKRQKLRVENGQDSVIFGSRDLLAQSFGNLLENAIKYTPPGGDIRLLIRKLPEKIEVEVADNGPGIPAEEKEHVLEKFVRLESSRHSPGNGLGLSLVAAVNRLHKAKLELVDASPGLRVVQRFKKLR